MSVAVASLDLEVVGLVRSQTGNGGRQVMTWHGLDLPLVHCQVRVVAEQHQVTLEEADGKRTKVTKQ